MEIIVKKRQVLDQRTWRQNRYCGPGMGGYEVNSFLKL